MAKTQQTKKAKNDPKNKKKKDEEEEEEEEDKKPSRPKRGAKAVEKSKKSKAEAKSASKAKGKGKKDVDKDQDEEKKDDKNGKRSRGKDQDEEAEKAADQPKKGKKKAKIDLNDIRIGVDEYFLKKKDVQVYNKSGKNYDAKLLQDNPDDVNGKFYYLEVLQSKSKPDDFYFYTRWGKDFTKGQNKTIGPISEEAALKEWKKKLDEKTKKGDYYRQA